MRYIPALVTSNADSSAAPAQPRRVGLISLGCAKNLVDAEIMLGTLIRQGVEIVNDPDQADALIVNTCSFIDAAQEESVDAILESAEWRQRRRPDQAIIVSGCLPQRFADELPRLLPEVDAFMGIDQVEGVGAIVENAVRSRGEKALDRVPDDGTGERRAETPGASGKAARNGAVSPRPAVLNTPAPAPAMVDVHLRPSYIPHWDTPRFRLTPAHFAYVKIAEGCNHPCSFCIIPRMRGSHRSRALADVVEEARRLVEQGVRELNLISQDTTYYGLDLRPKRTGSVASPDRFAAAARELPRDAATLSRLLRALNDLPGDFWIRLLYTHPAHWTDELITTIAECPKVARYVDMPLQHIHDDMLARMRRETSGAYIRDLIARIRRGIPGITLRTTFIVGFPGETREHFETLLQFMRETRFERVGVFQYSQEEGTVAGRMEQQVPVATRRRRRERAMAVQREISARIMAGFVGRQLRVLVEGPARPDDVARVLGTESDADGRGCAVARGEADAPDIDGRVYVRGNLPAGGFAEVRVVAHTDYDLIAEPLT